MSNQSLNTNVGKGNVEQARDFLAASFDVENHSCLMETLDTIDKAGDLPFPEDDLHHAAAELHGVDETFLSLVQDMREDPEKAECVKFFVEKYIELEEQEEGAGKEFIEFVREFERACRIAKAKIDCVYCGAKVPILEQDERFSEPCEVIPDVDDDEQWGELAVYHADDCEWIRTRAHQR